ncbi:MAG: 1-acyl-sn-glycerol-3-phosphate acyltransferase [Bacteroidales bacterium]|jgi:1-acyl-sn-glycerol-3-phosphate acyltransferase|nr:1-acyl-sn-glycerol-3-phosphate acyltransferase [Bacteroidales bacterium]
MFEPLDKKMGRFSKGYAFVRTFFVFPVFLFFYRKIQVVGRNSAPKGPVIFTPNHQNALMDAICILCTENRQPVFVARADIFRHPVVIRILHFLHILPVYRKRDGAGGTDNNQETFDVLIRVLRRKRAMGIMPEGGHNEKKRLNVLQKGVFRIAMKAQEEYGNNKGVKIVPVGLEYSDTRKFRSDVIIRYGEALEMSDYYGLYAENPAKAFKLLQDTLSARMKEGMVHIGNDSYYHEIEWARRIFAPEIAGIIGLRRNGQGRLSAQQRIVAAMETLALENPDGMLFLKTQIDAYLLLLETYRFRDHIVAQPHTGRDMLWRILLLLAGTPLWMAGLLFNYIPYRLSVRASSKVKDPQFISSVQYVACVVLFPLYYLTVAILSIVFVPCVSGKICTVAAMLPAGLFALWWYRSLQTTVADIRFLKHGKNCDTRRMITLRKNLLETLARAVSQTA